MSEPPPKARNVSAPDIGHARGHDASIEGGAAQPRLGVVRVVEPIELSAELAKRFHALYRQHFDFVFRNVRRLGVPDAQVDDAVQDVFLVVLRQLHKFTEGTHSKAWLFAIALRVARNYRRRHSRKEGLAAQLDPGALRAPEGDGPFEHALKAQAGRFLQAFLERIDDDKRSVFVMAELEQMSAPEIAAALELNLNTVYGRIRAARRAFELAVNETEGALDDE
ncbi:MAG: RNA polymerase sigma factor [Polyangiales bacterium]